LLSGISGIPGPQTLALRKIPLRRVDSLYRELTVRSDVNHGSYHG